MGEDVDSISFVPYSHNSLSCHVLRFKLLFPTKSPIVVGLLFLIVLLSLLMMPHQTLADEEYRFERMWPTLQQPWYFSQSNGIAIDYDGHVYTADTFNRRIMKFTSNGNFVTKWREEGSEEGEFDYPNSIAIDNNGFVYVADTNNYRMQKFTINGQFVAICGTERAEDSDFGGWAWAMVDAAAVVLSSRQLLKG